MSVHMMNYVTPDDLPLMQKLNITTALVELTQNESHWKKLYDTAIRHAIKLIPLIWGQDQSIWHWNQKAKEWELDARRYPHSIGARFLRFLREQPRYREQTFAIYSFHKLLAEIGHVDPERMKTFDQQITEEIFPKEDVKVYGKDMTNVWPQGKECLTEVIDYEVHTFYPFAASNEGRYRPFLPEGHYGNPTSDIAKILALQRDVIERQLKNIQQAQPAATGRKPQLIVILQTFVDPTQKGLWDRMPEADEMKKVAEFLIENFSDQLAGIAWYCFRRAASHYTRWLHQERYDANRRDRWQVIADIGNKLRGS